MGGGAARATEAVDPLEPARHIPVAPEALDDSLVELRELLGEAYLLWKELNNSADAVRREPYAELAKIVLRMKDLDGFHRSQGRAIKLASTMTEAGERLSEARGLLALRGADSPEGYAELLEDHAEVVELSTLHDALVSWGTSRSLDHDSAMPMDEADSWILDPRQFEVAGLPPLPPIPDTPAPEEYRAALAPTVVERWLAVAGEHLATIRDRQAAILRLSEDQRGGRLTFYSGIDFRFAKMAATTYLLAAARLKAARNAAAALLSGSDLLRSSPGLRLAWDASSQAFERVVAWGESNEFDHQWRPLDDHRWRPRVLSTNFMFLERDEFSKRHVWSIESVSAAGVQ